MVDEQYDDKYDTHEESEYHFSDDQANYEMELDGLSGKGAAVTIAQPTGNIADKLKQHRRVVIGLIIFIILLGIVYKIISPSSTAPTTDFAAATAPTTKSLAVSKPVVAKAAPAVPPPATVVTAVPAATPVAQPVLQTPPPVQPVAPAVAATPAPTIQPVSVPAPVAAPLPVANEMANNHLQDRVLNVEQQNAAMMNMLQTQYAQKITDVESQNAQLRADVQELKARMSSMEVAFRQLTKMLHNVRTSPSSQHMEPFATSANTSMNMNASPMSNDSNMMYDNSASSTRAASKTGYTVQAIIPGRAWLKSESGETITVAEGDVLKDFGRVTKIDPYDGLVNIDTGSKMITLSYGVNGD